MRKRNRSLALITAILVYVLAQGDINAYASTFSPSLSQRSTISSRITPSGRTPMKPSRAKGKSALEETIFEIDVQILALQTQHREILQSYEQSASHGIHDSSALTRLSRSGEAIDALLTLRHTLADAA